MSEDEVEKRWVFMVGNLKAIDRICDAFETAWQKEKHPDLAMYLSRIEGPDQDGLLDELIPLDLAYRSRRGETPRADDYRSFGDRAFQVATAAIHRNLSQTIDPTEIEATHDPDTDYPWASVDPTCSIGLEDFLESEGTSDDFHGTQDQDPASGAQPRKPSTVRGRTTLKTQPGEQWTIEPKADSSVRYRPLKMHAKGGLGAVYQGNDSELGRIVALKRILPEREDDEGTRARFIFEAEVTGSLEHPGIVPVYGLSHYENGRPYYAMRFIRGTSFSTVIRKFHDSHPDIRSNAFQDRAFRQLLRHFIDCCNALHYAHEKGVLHRDIKPDNVMLGQYGETLVVDWGLAKILEADSDDKANRKRSEDKEHGHEKPLQISTKAGRTSMGTIVGTPLYMSPEQAMGLQDELTPASDIYSLGAMLFKIISDQSVVEGKTTRDVIFNVRDGKLMDFRSIAATAPKALISICKKATAINPTDRYRTATALADDLDRWLSNDAVLAHEESMLERSARLLKRYSAQAVTAAIALSLITLIALLAMVLIYNAKKNEEQAKLRARAFKSEAVERYRDSRRAIDSWLVESGDALEFFPGTSSVRSRLLEIAAEDFDKLAGEVSRDPELELERGRVLIRLGDLHRTRKALMEAQGRYRDAIELLDSQPREVLDDNLSTLYRAESANTRSRLALCLAEDGQVNEAEKYSLAATEQLAELSRRTDDPIVQRYRGAALINSANLAINRNQNELARSQLSQATRVIGSMGTLTKAKLETDEHLLLTKAEVLTGDLAIREGRLQDAIEILNATERRMNVVLGAAPDDPTVLDTMASLIVLRASAHRSLGQIENNILSLRTAVEHYRSLRRAVPDLPLYTTNLARTLSDLGLVLMDQHRCADAEPFLIESKTLLERLASDYGDLIEFQEIRAATNDAHAQIKLALGEPAEAMEHGAQAILAYQQLNGQYPERDEFRLRIAICQSHYAQVIASTVTEGDDSEATSTAKLFFDSAIERLLELNQANPNSPSYQATIAYIYEQQGKFLFKNDAAAGEASFDNAIESMVDLGPARDPRSTDRLAWMLLTRLPKERQDPAESIRYATLASDATPESNAFRCTLALAQLRSSDVAAAEATLKPIIESPANQRTGREWLTLARFYEASEQNELAKEAKEQGRQWYADQAPNHPELVDWDE